MHGPREPRERGLRGQRVADVGEGERPGATVGFDPDRGVDRQHALQVVR